jgi:hypothetical protein
MLHEHYEQHKKEDYQRRLKKSKPVVRILYLILIIALIFFAYRALRHFGLTGI